MRIVSKWVDHFIATIDRDLNAACTTEMAPSDAEMCQNRQIGVQAQKCIVSSPVFIYSNIECVCVHRSILEAVESRIKPTRILVPAPRNSDDASAIQDRHLLGSLCATVAKEPPIHHPTTL